MTLREAIDQRRKAIGASNPATQAKSASLPHARNARNDDAKPPPTALPLTLRLFRIGKRRSSFPWSCYQGAEYFPQSNASTDAAGCEQILMTFIHHEVLVRGKNLEALMDEIDGLRVSELREIPEKLHLGAEDADDEPTILKIEVKKTGR